MFNRKINVSTVIFDTEVFASQRCLMIDHSEEVSNCEVHRIRSEPALSARIQTISAKTPYSRWQLS